MRSRRAVFLTCLICADLLRPSLGGAQQSTGELTGSEVYKTASATPLEYRSIKVSCGAVVLWTR